MQEPCTDPFASPGKRRRSFAKRCYASVGTSTCRSPLAEKGNHRSAGLSIAAVPFELGRESGNPSEESRFPTGQDAAIRDLSLNPICSLSGQEKKAKNKPARWTMRAASALCGPRACAKASVTVASRTRVLCPGSQRRPPPGVQERPNPCPSPVSDPPPQPGQFESSPPSQGRLEPSKSARFCSSEWGKWLARLIGSPYPISAHNVDAAPNNA